MKFTSHYHFYFCKDNRKVINSPEITIFSVGQKSFVCPNLLIMSFGRKKSRVREKSCLRCFAFIRADSRKCKFCGYIYKSSGKYLAEKFLHALRIDRVFSVSNGNGKTSAHDQKFFTPGEIEKLTSFKNARILMFMNLDDVNLLDETALILLGETLISLNKH